MTLRPLIPRVHARALLPAALVVLVLLLGRSASAGTGNYPTTLYLGGAASSILAASNGIVASAGPGTPASAPTATAGSTGVLTGSYTYEYTETDSGGETAPSAASTTISVASKSITVGNLPTGVNVNLYRKGSTGIYHLVTTLSSNSSPTYSDNATDTTVNAQTILPLSQNRPATFATGYYAFVPRSPMTTTSATSSSVASPTFSGKGWLVDGAGAVSYAAGTWTFTTNLRTPGTSTGTAHLVIGMWVVDATGAVVGSPLIDPTSGGENTTANITTNAGTTSPISTSISVPAFSIGNGQHLYVQFWRRQTAGSTGNPTTTLYVYDGNTKISTPTPTPLPNLPALASPASGVRVNTAPQLSATYSDSVDSGTVTMELCSDSLCSTVVDTSTSGTLSDGGTFNWTPSATLTDGTTYYWRARDTDGSSNQSGWTTENSFVYDTTKPSAPTLGSPSAGARTPNATLTATYVDPDATETGGTIDFQLCSDTSCTSVVASGSASRASGSYSPSVGDGTYYWRAQDVDTAGNQSNWSAARSFTRDTTAPSISAGTTGALLTSAPALTASGADPDVGDTPSVRFQLCSDNACGSVLQAGAGSPWTPSGLGSGTYYWRAQATDGAGNTSPWSTTQSFQLDVTAPTVSLGGTSARVQSVPQLAATFADAEAADTGTVTVQLCATSSCTSVLQSSTSAGGQANGTTYTWTPAGVADGTYYWRARTQDAAGNQSSWSPASSFVVDTVPPSTPALSSPADGTRANALSLAAPFSDPDGGDTGTVSFQLCADSACCSVVETGSGWPWSPASVGDGTYYWRARATDAAGNQSGWSATRAVTLDTVAPAVPALGDPADGAYLATAPALSGSFSDPDPGDSGTVGFQVCSDAACATVVASGSGSPWTPFGLVGAYYWRAQATDAAGNSSAWSATRSFTVDSTPPDVPTPVSPADGKRFIDPPQLDARYTESSGAGGSLTLELCKTSCATPLATTTVSSLVNGSDATWNLGQLSDGTYLWRAHATDTAGNASGWTATSSFTVDTTPPVVDVRPPALRSNAAPALTVGLSSPGDPSDSARALVQVCSDAGCNDVIASGWTGNGAKVSWQPPALTDGVYWWRALGEDVVGNQSAWSSGSSFVVDTVAPDAPTLAGPPPGVRTNRARLGATISGGDATDRGRVEFEVCSDADCSSVIDDGAAATFDADGTATWTPSLSDGDYVWRARAVDTAGNASAWSATSSFIFDRTPPAQPQTGRATVSQATLTLRWRAPRSGETLTGYVLLINGRRVRNLNASTRVLRIRLKPNDRRTFAVAAVDSAGNVGAPVPLFAPRGVTVKRTHSK